MKMTKRLEMKKLILTMFLAVLLFAYSGFSYALESAPDYVQSPETLVRWLQEDFRVSLKMPDVMQSASETIDSRSGDCDDFARVVSFCLSEWNIQNDILIIKFKGLNIAHAICAWERADGNYSFTSNKELFRTLKRSIVDVADYYYPDWEEIIVADREMKIVRVIHK